MFWPYAWAEVRDHIPYLFVFFTPVPAGVGPVTIAMLLKHTVEAAEKANI